MVAAAAAIADALKAARNGNTRPSVGSRPASAPSMPITRPITPATAASRTPPPRNREAALEEKPNATTVAIVP